MKKLGEFSEKGRAEYDRLMRARRPGETVVDVERRERVCGEICQEGGEPCQGGPLGPGHGHICTCVPAGLCGEAGCVFKAGHEGEHSWGGAS